MARKIYLIILHSGELPAAHAYHSAEGRGTKLRQAVADGLSKLEGKPGLKGKRITKGTITFVYMGKEEAND